MLDYSFTVSLSNYYFCCCELQFLKCPPESNVCFCFFFGRYMVTSGMDKKLKVYDIRAFKPMKSYFLPAGASCLSLSQRGLLSAATGDIVQVTIISMLGD